MRWTRSSSWTSGKRSATHSTRSLEPSHCFDSIPGESLIPFTVAFPLTAFGKAQKEVSTCERPLIPFANCLQSSDWNTRVPSVSTEDSLHIAFGTVCFRHRSRALLSEDTWALVPCADF